MAEDLRNYASLWERGVAVFLDTILILLFLYLLTVFKPFEDPNLVLPYLILVYLVPLAYFITCEGVYGQTIGKKIMKIKVVGDRKKVGLKKSLIRNVLRVVDILPFFYIIGVISIIYTSRNQRLGDLTARTFVIRK